MKTPREILLQKHRDAEPRLDAIRAEVLRGEFQRDKERTPIRGAIFFALNQLWSQLILPSRRIWTGLATLWLVVIALNLAAPDDVSPSYAATPLPPATPERQMALQEQQQLFAELLHGNNREEADTRRYIPRPSSRCRPAIRHA